MCHFSNFKTRNCKKREHISFREYDVFISHASEDKDSIVRPLAEALIAENLQVWYDEFTLRIGDSLRRKIDSGLAKDRGLNNLELFHNLRGRGNS
jgi:hypothetical protein